MAGCCGTMLSASAISCFHCDEGLDWTGDDTHPRPSLLGPGLPAGGAASAGAGGARAWALGSEPRMTPGGASVPLLASPRGTLRGHQLVLGWRQARKTSPLNKTPGPCPLPDPCSESGHGAGSLATSEPWEALSRHFARVHPHLVATPRQASVAAASLPAGSESPTQGGFGTPRLWCRRTRQAQGTGGPPGTGCWEAAPGRRSGRGRGRRTLWHIDHSQPVLTRVRDNVLSWDPKFSWRQGTHSGSHVSGAGLAAGRWSAAGHQVQPCPCLL